MAGQDQPQLTQGLLSLLIAENVNGLYRCEAVFNNWGTINNSIGFLFFDRDLLDFGKPFQVKLGTDLLFDGFILGMEARFPQGNAPALSILAEDRFQDLRMTRRTRTFSDVSDAEVMRQIASEHGLTPMIDVTGPQYEVLAQINQSDLAFLRERAHAIDAELSMTGNIMSIQAHTKRTEGNLQITYGHELREFSVLADLAGQRSSVAVSGWDVANKQMVKHEATDVILNGELHGGLSGAHLLTSTLGRRKEALVHTAPFTLEEAQAEAEAYFKLQARRFVTGHGIAEATSQLQVGNVVQLQGLGPLFSGRYYLSEVMHLFDSMHRVYGRISWPRPDPIIWSVTMMEPTSLEMLLDARVPSGFGGRWYGVYPALVSDVKDPAGQGRVKITLPWSPDTDSARYETWARLGTFMGGNNRGSWFIPDVNDEVLVVFLAGDPRHPYVIGSVWNGKDVPPQAMDAAGQNNLKVLRSRNGVKITLDDTTGLERMTLETPGGQTVTLKDGPSSLEIHDSNGNVIRMEAGGITITGPHVTITAPAFTVTSALATFSGTVQATAFIPPPGAP